jgi:hypothetical protein
VNKPEPIDLSTLQRPPSKSFENGLARDSADLSSLTYADIIFGKIVHDCRLTIMLPYRSSIRSGANMRPATAREATVPWLNESRCARDDLENASPGQADCLTFFIAPGAFHQRKGERIKCQFSRINLNITTVEDDRTWTSTSSTTTPIVLFHLTTPEALASVEGNVTAEAQFFGTALVLEPRYVAALIRGMPEDGLEMR